jgi:hypothetical protein
MTGGRSTLRSRCSLTLVGRPVLAGGVVGGAAGRSGGGGGVAGVRRSRASVSKYAAGVPSTSR